MAESDQTAAPQPVVEKAALPNQQPMQFIPFNPEQQQPLLNPNGDISERPFSKRWHIAKLVLGSASIVASIILWAVAIVVLARYTRTGYNYDSFQITFEVAFVLAAAGLAILWQAAEFITIWASASNRGIHPGANVALHLIIWLLAALAVGFLGVFVSFDLSRLEDMRYHAESADDMDSVRYSRYYYDYDVGAFEQFLRLEETLLAFTAVLVLLHLVLFVRACVETHRYNNTPLTRTVYVQVPVPVQAAGGEVPGQQPAGYFAYQPLAGQAPAFVPPQGLASGGVPVQPAQAHLYGYYAPVPAPAAASGMPPQQVRGGSQTAAGSVNPVSSSRR